MTFHASKSFFNMVIPLTHHKKQRSIAIRLKIQTKSSHKTHKSQLLRLDFVNLKSWIAIAELKVVGGYLSPAAGGGKISCDQLSFCLPHFQQVC